MKKNILFLFPDQHRGDWLPYDNEIFDKMAMDELPLNMPNVRKLMDEGTTFTRAITSSPLCVPARACLASGLRYDNCGVLNNKYSYPLQQRTFYSVLRETGYNVGGVGKFDLHKPYLYWGKDGWLEQLAELGYTHAIDNAGKYDLVWSSFYQPRGPYAAYLHDNNLIKEHCKDYIVRYLNANDTSATPLPEEAYCDNWVTQNALDMLDNFDAENKPWFLMVNFPGPHNPWDVTEKMKERWKDIDFPLPVNYEGNKEEINTVRQNYAAMLENIDMNIGKIIRKISDMGELSNTIIVYASDHGEMLGDNSRYLKSVPDRASIHIPLVISDPDSSNKGVYSDVLVELQDLASTFAAYAGTDMPEAKDSLSLKGVVRGGEEVIREYQMSKLYNSAEPDPTNGHEYEEYEQYKKRGTDAELIDEFNQYYNIETTSFSMKKMDLKYDWEVIMNKNFKLVVLKDDEVDEENRYKLYDLVNDPWEQNDLSSEKPGIIRELLSKLRD